jgi:hypothetical protein
MNLPIIPYKSILIFYIIIVRWDLSSPHIEELSCYVICPLSCSWHLISIIKSLA